MQQVTISYPSPTAIRIYTDTSSDAGSINERTFCTTCSSVVKNVNPNFGAYVSVPVGVIGSGKEGLEPKMEYFCKRRSRWLGETFSGVAGDRRWPELPGKEDGEKLKKELLGEKKKGSDGK